jgi:choline dehydrogenase-like flavoprotein
VCIVGSGFGGSISAWRLAELYKAAGEDAARILVLERGRGYEHSEFRQSMDADHLAEVYKLAQSTVGTGAQVVTANAVGGGSNLYLAASLRAPSEIFERHDRNPADPGEGRVWPAAIDRKEMDRYYARAEAALRVRQPSWNEVSKSGGLWAATLDAAGHTADRVPVAIDFDRCVDAKWCHTGCVFGAKNTVTTNYLASARRAGVRVRESREAQLITRAAPNASGYRYLVQAAHMSNRGDSPTHAPNGSSDQIECKVLILAAGAMGTSPLLLRSRLLMPSLSSQVGAHLGCNGDHIAALEYDEKQVRRVLGLPGYGEFYKGKPITTMTYDYYAGRPGRAHDGTRFTLQEIFLSTLTNFLYDDGRSPQGSPSFFGVQKKRSISHWNSHIELLAMVEDTNDGRFLIPPISGGGIQPSPGPVVVGTFSYDFSEQSMRVREVANKAMKKIAERKGLARFMALTESRGTYVAHPLGGCRMAEDPALGVVNHECEAFGNDGLFCIDSSAIPTSLGVNPSLTISAVSERAAAHLVRKAERHGLPKAPKGFRHRTPAVHVGKRLTPS